MKAPKTALRVVGLHQSVVTNPPKRAHKEHPQQVSALYLEKKKKKKKKLGLRKIFLVGKISLRPNVGSRWL